jgi:hypothetical protein
LVIAATLAVVFAGGCSAGGAGRSAVVDHSTEMFFPPIGGPQQLGDCTCWSSCYYYNTYTQARDEGLDASTGDPNVLCSQRFLFALIAEGAGGAECTANAMARLADVGCATAAKHPVSTHCAVWPTEDAWIAALRNRPGKLHKIRVDNPAGLETVKQHIADGGCAVTRALFHRNYVDYGDSAGGPGIDNHVLYAGVGPNHLRHSLCICGYDDTLSYVDDRDGETYSGAFLIANSEGPDWGWHNSTGAGTKGFLWVAYNLFLEGGFGLYDHDDNPYTDPCYDNPDYPEVYFHDDRPHYRPVLIAVAGINHPSRNLLTFTGGVGPADAPLFMGPEAITWTDHGEIAINDSRRVAVDLTDGAGLIAPGTSQAVFVSLTVDDAASAPATITSVDFYCDFDGDGRYTAVPVAMASPTRVAAGTTVSVSARVAVPTAGAK